MHIVLNENCLTMQNNRTGFAFTFLFEAPFFSTKYIFVQSSSSDYYVYYYWMNGIHFIIPNLLLRMYCECTSPTYCVECSLLPFTQGIVDKKTTKRHHR